MIWNCGRFQFDVSSDSIPLVMGILNVTPDSFSDGGNFLNFDHALRHIESMILDGANIIDIGGESSRPGSKPISPQQELDRIGPILEKIKNYPIAISVDTHKEEIMRFALNIGVDCINDIYALQKVQIGRYILDDNCGIILMHMQKNPEIMQLNPQYNCVLTEINSFFKERCIAMEKAGIFRNRLVLDPGFGFGKKIQHNMKILNNLQKFKNHNLPIMIGFSKKSNLSTVSKKKTNNLTIESVSAALIGVERGAKIVRVHDVKSTVDALKVWAFSKELLYK